MGLGDQAPGWDAEGYHAIQEYTWKETDKKENCVLKPLGAKAEAVPARLNTSVSSCLLPV